MKRNGLLRKVIAVLMMVSIVFAYSGIAMAASGNGAGQQASTIHVGTSINGTFDNKEEMTLQLSSGDVTAVYQGSIIKVDSVNAFNSGRVIKFVTVKGKTGNIVITPHEGNDTGTDEVFHFDEGKNNYNGEVTFDTVSAGYKVEYYLQNDESGYTLTETDTLTAKAGTEVSAEIKEFEGYTYNSNVTETVVGGTVTEDGSLVLKLYYDKKSQEEPKTAGYKVEHYLQNDSDGYDLATDATETKSGKIGEEVTAAEKNFDGYKFNDKVTGTVMGGTVIADGSLVLKLYYDKTNTTPDNPQKDPQEEPKTAEYKVEHYLQNDNGGFNLKDAEAGTGKVNDTVTAAAKIYAGYTYKADAEGTVVSGKITEDGTLVLKLYYVKETTPGGNTDTPVVDPNGGKDPRNVPVVDPEDPAEDPVNPEKPVVDDGGNSSITPHVLGDDETLDDEDDSMDTVPNGTPDEIDEAVAAAPNGVKTGDATDMIPWALGFGSAVMMLGGAVALRRKED